MTGDGFVRTLHYHSTYGDLAEIGWTWDGYETDSNGNTPDVTLLKGESKCIVEHKGHVDHTKCEENSVNDSEQMRRYLGSVSRLGEMALCYESDYLSGIHSNRQVDDFVHDVLEEFSNMDSIGFAVWEMKTRTNDETEIAKKSWFNHRDRDLNVLMANGIRWNYQAPGQYPLGTPLSHSSNTEEIWIACLNAIISLSGKTGIGSTFTVEAFVKEMEGWGYIVPRRVTKDTAMGQRVSSHLDRFIAKGLIQRLDTGEYEFTKDLTDPRTFAALARDPEISTLLPNIYDF